MAPRIISFIIDGTSIISNGTIKPSSIITKSASNRPHLLRMARIEVLPPGDESGSVIYSVFAATVTKAGRSEDVELGRTRQFNYYQATGRTVFDLSFPPLVLNVPPEGVTIEISLVQSDMKTYKTTLPVNEYALYKVIPAPVAPPEQPAEEETTAAESKGYGAVAAIAAALLAAALMSQS